MLAREEVGKPWPSLDDRHPGCLSGYRDVFRDTALNFPLPITVTLPNRYHLLGDYIPCAIMDFDEDGIGLGPEVDLTEATTQADEPEEELDVKTNANQRAWLVKV